MKISNHLPKISTPSIPDLCQTSVHLYNSIKNGSSGASSIEQCPEKEPILFQRPKLEPPKHYLLDLLEMHNRVEKITAAEISQFRNQSDKEIAEIERLDKEREEALRRNAEEAASRGYWNALKNVAHYITGSASIAVGMALGSSWGSFMIASGAIGMTSRVIQDTAGWASIASWFTKSVEHQRKLAQKIETGFWAAELGIGLAGGIGAGASRAFSTLAHNASNLSLARKTGYVLQGAATALQMSGRLGKTYLDKRTSEIQARLKMLDTESETIRMQMNHHLETIKSALETTRSIDAEMQKFLAASELQDL